MKFRAENFEILRKERGLTFQQIANHLGITAKAVHKWSVGDSEPRMKRIKQLASFLQCHEYHLIASGNPQEPQYQMCHTMQAALEIQDKVNDVIIALAADRDINTAIKLCAEIMNDLEAEYL